MLYPLSYEGVPIQYKAPRTSGRHSPPKPSVSTGSHPTLIPHPSLVHRPMFTTRVHHPKTPAPGDRTAPTMYE